MIPVARPVFGEEEVEAVSAVIRSGMIASGEVVTRFEDEYAAYAGVKHAIATSNGTTALHAGLLGSGIVPGDEVIVPSFTFIATATSVSMCGATPVVADVDINTCCIDPDSVAEQITPKPGLLSGSISLASHVMCLQCNRSVKIIISSLLKTVHRHMVRSTGGRRWAISVRSAVSLFIPQRT